MAEYTIANIQEQLADADRANKQAKDNTVNLQQTFLRAQAQTIEIKNALVWCHVVQK